jgi:hypothetical protein
MREQWAWPLTAVASLTTALYLIPIACMRIHVLSFAPTSTMPDVQSTRSHAVPIDHFARISGAAGGVADAIRTMELTVHARGEQCATLAAKALAPDSLCGQGMAASMTGVRCHHQTNLTELTAVVSCHPMPWTPQTGCNPELCRERGWHCNSTGTPPNGVHASMVVPPPQCPSGCACTVPVPPVCTPDACPTGASCADAVALTTEYRAVARRCGEGDLHALGKQEMLDTRCPDECVCCVA